MRLDADSDSFFFLLTLYKAKVNLGSIITPNILYKENLKVDDTVLSQNKLFCNIANLLLSIRNLCLHFAVLRKKKKKVIITFFIYHV